MLITVISMTGVGEEPGAFTSDTDKDTINQSLRCSNRLGLLYDNELDISDPVQDSTVKRELHLEPSYLYQELVKSVIMDFMRPDIT